MKKILLVCMSAVALVSCSSDEDPVIVGEAALVGTWYYSGATEDGETFPPTDCEKESNIVFRANGTGTENASYDSDVVEGCETFTNIYEYSTSEGILQLTTTVEEEEVTVEMAYEINGKTLTFDYGDNWTRSYTKR